MDYEDESQLKDAVFDREVGWRGSITRGHN